MKKVKTNNLTYNLFPYKKKYWYKNLKGIPVLFKRFVFLLRHGYTPAACWDTYAWFIDTMTEILEWHRNERLGTPCIMLPYQDTQEWEDNNNVAWNAILDDMINMLYFMRDDFLGGVEAPVDVEGFKERTKDNFMKLFAKYFYNLWD